jgi:hypothetical protein
VQEHQNSVQLRSACDGGRDSDASLQFVRKISGFSKPSKANEAAFEAAVDEIAEASTRLLHSLKTNSSPRNRDEEAAKAKLRFAQRDSALKSA